MIDMFSGWIECFPCMTQQADITVLCIYEWICRYSIPERIYCDGGPHFVNKIVVLMVTRYGIKLCVGPSHHSQRQGKVEHMIKTIKGLLKKMCDQYQGPWVNWLSAACYIVRTNVYLGHGFTPFFLVHGRQPRGIAQLLEYDLHDLPFIEASTYPNIQENNSDPITSFSNLDTNESMTEEIELLSNRLQQILILNEEIIPQAAQRQVLIKQNQAVQFDIQNRAKVRKYHIGDSVLMKNNTLRELSTHHLGAIWIGPYKVNRILPRDVYILSDGKLQLPSPVHANNIKKYMSRPKDNYLYRKWSVGEDQEEASEETNKEISEPTSPIIRKRRRQVDLPSSN